MYVVERRHLRCDHQPAVPECAGTLLSGALKLELVAPDCQHRQRRTLNHLRQLARAWRPDRLVAGGRGQLFHPRSVSGDQTGLREQASADLRRARRAARGSADRCEPERRAKASTLMDAIPPLHGERGLSLARLRAHLLTVSAEELDDGLSG